MKDKGLFNKITQYAIPILTIGAQVALAMKFPQRALVVMLLAQPFWFYSAWKAYKSAGQIGILVNTIIFTLVTVAGIMNYLIN